MFLIVQDGAIKMSAKLISYVKLLVLKNGKNLLVAIKMSRFLIARRH